MCETRALSEFIIRVKHVRECCEVLFLFCFVSSNLYFVENMSANRDKSTTDDSSIPADLKLWKEALVGEMRQMMRGELEQLHERLD